MEVIRGSADVFRDLSETDADGKQLKALRAAEIIQVLDRYRLTVRAVRQRTDVPAADFFRIRNANLERFSLDRLMGVASSIAWVPMWKSNSRSGLACGRRIQLLPEMGSPTKHLRLGRRPINTENH